MQTSREPQREENLDPPSTEWAESGDARNERPFFRLAIAPDDAGNDSALNVVSGDIADIAVFGHFVGGGSFFLLLLLQVIIVFDFRFGPHH